MSKLKELTWENHSKAERTEHARKLLKGMSPQEYHRYIFNQYIQYSALETRAAQLGLLDGIENIVRGDKIKQDMVELEEQHDIERDPDLICEVVPSYVSHVLQLDEQGTLAHLYVRHFGDMYGGQMIKKRNPGTGVMYEFEDVETLKTTVRAMLNDEMADEANRCFEFAMELFEQLDDNT